MHGSRRPRRACFGALVQLDASRHDWLEGRGEDAVLIGRSDETPNPILARFYHKSDKVRTEDTSHVAKMRTFPMSPDIDEESPCVVSTNPLNCAFWVWGTAGRTLPTG